MKNSNRKLKGFLLIILSVMLSALIEVAFFNGIKMHNIGNNKGTFSLKDYTKVEKEIIKVPINSENDENKNSILFNENLDLDGFEINEVEGETIENSQPDTIEYEEKEAKHFVIDLSKMYVDRISMKYHTKNDYYMRINYTNFDEYGNPFDDSIDVNFLKEFNTTTIAINSDIEKIEFNIYDDDTTEFDISDILVVNEFCFNIYRFFLLFIFLISISILYIFRKIIFKKIEYLFLIVALCTGIAQIFIIPCLTVYSWDDHVHLERMYSLFEHGDVKTTKSFDFSYSLRSSRDGISSSYENYNLVYNYLNKNNNIAGEGIVNENKFISYDSFTYIPSAIAIKICKILKTPYTLLFHMGKIVNLLIYIVIMFYTIKNAKVGKKLLFVLSLLPTTIFLAAQYSRDAIITAGIYLALSVFLNCYCDKEKMNQKNLIIFIASIIVASLSKAIYVPFLLLLLIMPSNKFENSRNAKWIKLLVVVLLFLAMSTFVFPAMTSSSSDISDIRGGNTSTGGQMKLIMSQPLSFTKVFGNYIKDVVFYQILGNKTLGFWHNFNYIRGEKYYILLFIIMFCAICSEDKSKIKIDLKLRLFLLSISFFIICLICGSMYLSFTPVAATTILGVQQRYFVPLLFAIFITFKNKNIICKMEDEKTMKIITMLLLYIYFFDTYNSIFMSLYS